MAQIEHVLALVGGYSPANGIELVQRSHAFVVALTRSGTPGTAAADVVTQALAAAETLADLQARAETVAAALLVDLAEETCPSATIAAQISETVAETVAAVRRMRKLPYLNRASRVSLSGKRRSEMYHAFVASLDSPQPILIELAHRVNKLRKLTSYYSPEERTIVFDAMEIHAPLADRLGIWRLKWELEDRAFQLGHPIEFQQIAGLLSEHQDEREDELRRVADQLSQGLAEAGISAEVTGRPKHIYSIYRKMQRKGIPLAAIHDVRGVRVLVDTESDCYRALGVVHRFWNPIPDQLDDYISNPKPNGYQSLHTAVTDEEGRSFEVQIRTHQMHQDAELGLAAHWRYKKRQASFRLTRKKHDLETEQAIEEKISWLRLLMDEQPDEEIGDTWPRDQEPDESAGEPIFVFSPAGDIIRLPAGATPIDFAYRIHTELGHRCAGARVNGSIVPLDSQLCNGDRVEIITRKTGGPNVNWLSQDRQFIRTRDARRKIAAWFRTQRRNKLVAKGHEVLDRELGRLGMKSTVSYEQVAALFRLTSSGELLSQIGSGQISSDRLRSVLTAQPKPTQGDLAREAETELVTEAEHATTIIEREPEPERRAAREPTGKGLLVAATDGIHSKLAKCCYPIPREAIVGFVTRGYGATIHVADCPNVTNVQDVGRIIPAAWGDTNTQTFPVMVMVEAINRRGLLGDIAQSVAKEKVDIREAKALKKGHWALFELLLEVATTNQLDRVMKKLADTKGVREVHRKRG